jgi:hypothetical protein
VRCERKETEAREGPLTEGDEGEGGSPKCQVLFEGSECRVLGEDVLVFELRDGYRLMGGRKSANIVRNPCSEGRMAHGKDCGGIKKERVGSG